MRILVSFTALFRNVGLQLTLVWLVEGFVFRTASAIGWLSHPNPTHRWDCPPLQASTSRAAGGTGALPKKEAFTVVVFSAWVRRSLNT